MKRSKKFFKHSPAYALVSFAILSAQQSETMAANTMTKVDGDVPVYTITTDTENTTYKWKYGVEGNKTGSQIFDSANETTNMDMRFETDNPKTNKVVFNGIDGARLEFENDDVISNEIMVFNSNMTVSANAEGKRSPTYSVTKGNEGKGVVDIAEGKDVHWYVGTDGDEGVYHNRYNQPEEPMTDTVMVKKGKGTLHAHASTKSSLVVEEGDVRVYQYYDLENINNFYNVELKNDSRLTFDYSKKEDDLRAWYGDAVKSIGFGNGGGTVDMGKDAHVQVGNVHTINGKGKFENGRLVLVGKPKEEVDLIRPDVFGYNQVPERPDFNSIATELDVRGLTVTGKEGENVTYVVSNGAKIGGDRLANGDMDFDSRDHSGLFINKNANVILQGYQNKNLEKDESANSPTGYKEFYFANEKIDNNLEERNYDIGYVVSEGGLTIGQDAVVKIGDIYQGDNSVTHLGVSLRNGTHYNRRGDVNKSDIDGDFMGITAVGGRDGVTVIGNESYVPEHLNPQGEARKKLSMNTNIHGVGTIHLGNIDYTGNIKGNERTHVTLAETTKWQINQDTNIGNLEIGYQPFYHPDASSDSHIYLGDMNEVNPTKFNTLRVGGTEGLTAVNGGTIHFRTNMQEQTGDRLSVTKLNNAHFKVSVKDTGAEPTRDKVSLTLIESDEQIDQFEGNDSAVRLADNKEGVDIGAYRYILKGENNFEGDNGKNVIRLYNKTVDLEDKAEKEKQKQEEEARRIAEEEAEKQKQKELEDAIKKAEEDRKKAEEERAKAEEERKKAEAEREKAEKERQQAEMDRANDLKKEAEKLVADAIKKFEEAKNAKTPEEKEKLKEEGERLAKEAVDKNEEANGILESLGIEVDRNPVKPKDPNNENKPIVPEKPKEEDKTPAKQVETMSGISNVAVSDLHAGTNIMLQNSQRVGRLFLIDPKDDVAKVWTEGKKQDFKVGEGSEGFNRAYKSDATYVEIGARTVANDDGISGGVILSQTAADNKYHEDGTGKIKYHQGTVFLKAQSDEGYFAIADASYGRSQNKVSLNRRDENGKEFNAKFNRNHMSTGLNVGKKGEVLGLDVVGMAGLHYHHIGSANYELDKAKVETDSIGLMSYNVGVGVSKTFKDGDLEFRPRANVTYFTTGNKTFDDVVKVNGIGFNQQFVDGINYEVGLGVKIKDAWRAEVMGSYGKGKNSSSVKQVGVHLGYEF